MRLKAHSSTITCMGNDDIVGSCEKRLRRQSLPRENWSLTMKSKGPGKSHYVGQDVAVGPHYLAGKGKSKGKGKMRTKSFDASPRNAKGEIVATQMLFQNVFGQNWSRITKIGENWPVPFFLFFFVTIPLAMHPAEHA